MGENTWPTMARKMTLGMAAVTYVTRFGMIAALGTGTSVTESSLLRRWLRYVPPQSLRPWSPPHPGSRRRALGGTAIVGRRRWRRRCMAHPQRLLDHPGGTGDILGGPDPRQVTEKPHNKVWGIYGASVGHLWGNQWGINPVPALAAATSVVHRPCHKDFSRSCVRTQLLATLALATRYQPADLSKQLRWTKGLRHERVGTRFQARSRSI